MIITLVIVSFILSDVTYAEEIIKGAIENPEIKSIDSQIIKGTIEKPEIKSTDSPILNGMEKLGKYITENKHTVAGGLFGLIFIIYISADTIIYVDNVIWMSDNWYGASSHFWTQNPHEAMRDVYFNTPGGRLESFQFALSEMPELKDTQNSPFLPEILTAKYELNTPMHKHIAPINNEYPEIEEALRNGNYSVVNWIDTGTMISNENLVYRVYMDYSDAAKNFDASEFYTQPGCAITHVTLLDPILQHTAPYTKIDVIKIDPNTLEPWAETSIYVKKH